jgi:hypothetical protein
VVLAKGISAVCTGRTAGAFLKNSVNNSIFLKKKKQAQVSTENKPYICFK